MNKLPITKLTALTKHFGADLLDDHARCDELLSEFCGEYRLEVSLLVSALRERCANELLDGATDGVVANDVYVRLVAQLNNNAGIMPEHAEWGVNAVAKVLDLRILSPCLKGPLAPVISNIAFHKLAQYAPRREINVINPLSHIEPLRSCKAYEDAVALAASYAVNGTVDEKILVTIGDFLETNGLDPILHFGDVIVEGFMRVANRMIEEGAVTAEDEHNLCLFLEQTADFFPIEEYAEYLSTCEKLVNHLSDVLVAPVVIPTVTESITPPVSIPSEHYEAVCKILMKSGNEWRVPSVWATIDNDVKALCTKARLGEHEIRNWMRFAWSSVEQRYEELQLTEQREKQATEKKLQDENRIKEQEADHNRNHIRLLRTWLGNLPNAQWDFDQWDTFIASLEPPINLNDLEFNRDNGIVNFNDYFKNDNEFSIIHLKTGLVWAKNGDIAGRPMQYVDAMNWVKNLNYSGHSDWRLPSEGEIKLFTKLGGTKPSVWFNSNGFTNIQKNYYWSSSTDGVKSAWVVNMDDGGSNCLFKVSAFFVWPVRNLRSR